MADEKRPWVKWYWADWRADSAVKMCKLAARGLWVEMLGIMDEAEPKGHLLVKGIAPSAGQLAGLVGASEREVRAMLKELKDAGVYSETDQGIIFSRRVVRDKAKSDIGRLHGITGGNPILTGKDKVGSPDKVKGGDKASRTRVPEARSQKPESTPLPPTAGANGSAPDHQAETARSVVRDFLRLRTEHWPADPNFPAIAATLETEARQFLTDGATAAILVATIERGMAGMRGGGKGPPTSLRAFHRSIATAIASAPPDPDKPLLEATDIIGQVLSDDDWRGWLRKFTGPDTAWPESFLGPKPGALDCKCPQRLVDEFIDVLDIPPFLRRQAEPASTRPSDEAAA